MVMRISNSFCVYTIETYNGKTPLEEWKELSWQQGDAMVSAGDTLTYQSKGLWKVRRPYDMEEVYSECEQTLATAITKFSYFTICH